MSPPRYEYLDTHPAPIVIKASGLAAGKGVIMAETQAEAIAAVKDMLEGNAFGASGHEIVIEETLYGEEASIHAIVSGDDFVCLPPSQDHKRAGEGDTGLNTGGMGAYTPTSRVTAEMQAQIEAQVLRPTLDGFKADGIHFCGTLYAGLMLTPKGVRVLEYNVRFGDPETQVLLPMVADDLVPVLLASAKGEALPAKLNFHPGAAIVIVLAAGGYPDSYAKGDTITLPTPLQSAPQSCTLAPSAQRMARSPPTVAACWASVDKRRAYKPPPTSPMAYATKSTLTANISGATLAIKSSTAKLAPCG